MKKLNIQKKGIIGPVISVFVMVLVISILVGLTFLFVSNLKDQVVDTTKTDSGSVANETGWINQSGYTFDEYSNVLEFSLSSITHITNESSGTLIPSANYTVIDNILYNATAEEFGAVNITYTYSYIGDSNAYTAVNDTEAAGATVVNYLSLIFLAVIFGAILTLVLRIILPYINLGRRFDGF